MNLKKHRGIWARIRFEKSSGERVGRWAIGYCGYNWLHVRNEVLKRYFKRYFDGRVTVEQFNKAIKKYCSFPMAGDGSIKAGESSIPWLRYGARVTNKRLVHADGNSFGSVIGRVFTESELEERLERIRANRKQKKIAKKIAETASSKCQESQKPKCQLYRHFDCNGVLLYVGISQDHLSRTYQHSKRSPWFEKIHYITVEHFETRDQAMEAELFAIRTELPLFNKKHSVLRAVA